MKRSWKLLHSHLILHNVPNLIRIGDCIPVLKYVKTETKHKCIVTFHTTITGGIYIICNQFGNLSIHKNLRAEGLSKHPGVVWVPVHHSTSRRSQHVNHLWHCCRVCQGWRTATHTKFRLFKDFFSPNIGGLCFPLDSAIVESVQSKKTKKNCILRRKWMQSLSLWVWVPMAANEAESVTQLEGAVIL